MIKVHVVIKTSAGDAIAFISDFKLLNYQLRTDGKVGAFTMEIGIKYASIFTVANKDYRVQVWRSINNMPAVLDGKVAEYFVEKWEMIADSILISGNSIQSLLSRRIIAYPANVLNYSRFVGYAGDIMKAIVNTNFSSGIISGRDGSDDYANISSYLSIGPNYNDGITLSIGCSRRNVLDTLTDLTNASYEDGIWIAGVITSDGNSFMFDTYETQFGITRSAPFSEIVGNIDNVQLTYDLSNQKTFVVAAGKGIEQARLLTTAANTTLMQTSVFNRSEIFYENTQVESVAYLRSLAIQELRANQGVQQINCDIVITNNYLRGLQYDVGDALTIFFNNRKYILRLDAVEVSIQNGKISEKGSFRV